MDELFISEVHLLKERADDIIKKYHTIQTIILMNNDLKNPPSSGSYPILQVGANKISLDDESREALAELLTAARHRLNARIKYQNEAIERIIASAQMRGGSDEHDRDQSDPETDVQ